MWSSLPKTFWPILPYNPHQALCLSSKFIWIQAYSALFYTPPYGLSTIWTPSWYSLLHIPHWLWPLILTPSSHLVPPPRFYFLQSYTNIIYVKLTTHKTYIPSIYGIRMLSEHSKPTHIHSSTISKFILRHHYDRETSAFRWDSYIQFFCFLRQYCIYLNTAQALPLIFIGTRKN